jgi:hypothetical protein
MPNHTRHLLTGLAASAASGTEILCELPARQITEIAQFLLYFCKDCVIYTAAIAIAPPRLGAVANSKELSNTR